MATDATGFEYEEVRGTFVKVAERHYCDFCKKLAHYDGKTTIGPWAYMCSPCFTELGCGLGTGRGQVLVYTV